MRSARPIPGCQSPGRAPVTWPSCSGPGFVSTSCRSSASPTARDEADRLIAWIRDRALRPVLHGTFRLLDLHRAEACFADRGSEFVGKLAIVPDPERRRHGARLPSEQPRRSLKHDFGRARCGPRAAARELSADPWRAQDGRVHRRERRHRADQGRCVQPQVRPLGRGELRLARILGGGALPAQQGPGRDRLSARR